MALGVVSEAQPGAVRQQQPGGAAGSVVLLETGDAVAGRDQGSGPVGLGVVSFVFGMKKIMQRPRMRRVGAMVAVENAGDRGAGWDRRIVRQAGAVFAVRCLAHCAAVERTSDRAELGAEDIAVPVIGGATQRLRCGMGGRCC